MSADKILKTQRYSNVLTSHGGKTVDFFSQRPSDRKKLVKPASCRRRNIAANQNFNWGSVVQFRIPQVSYLQDLFLVVKVSQPDANFRAGWGASVIESFRLRNSGKLIQEHLNYTAVYKHFMENLSAEKRAQMDKIIGQQGQSAQTIVIPIFAFWTSWNNPNMSPKGIPFQYDRLSGNEGLVVELTLNPVTAVIESSATPSAPNNIIQSAELVFYEWLTAPSLEDAHKSEKYVYHAHDYKVRTSIAMANTAAVNVDLTALTGHTKNYYVSCDLDTEAQQQDRTVNQPLSELTLQIDGREYQSVKTAEEIRADALLWNGKGCNEGNNGSNILPFSLCSTLIQSGGLNSQDVKDVKLVMKQSNGGAATASIVAVQDVIFSIENGSLRRQE